MGKQMAWNGYLYLALLVSVPEVAGKLLIGNSRLASLVLAFWSGRRMQLFLFLISENIGGLILYTTVFKGLFSQEKSDYRNAYTKRVMTGDVPPSAPPAHLGIYFQWLLAFTPVGTRHTI